MSLPGKDGAPMVCPHCGTTLHTRGDYRQHLSLKTCMTARPEGWEHPYPQGFDADWRRALMEEEKG